MFDSREMLLMKAHVTVQRVATGARTASVTQRIVPRRRFGGPIPVFRASLLAVTLLATVPASASTITNLVSFGDSLSDTGNLFEVTGDPFVAFLIQFLFPELDPPIPGPPYHQGRFSNGPVWIDHVVADLGLGPAVPSESGGLNYAVGGATTFDGGNVLINAIIPDDVEDQVPAYLAQHTPAGSELFVVEGGANDLLSGGITDVTIPASNIEGFITDLYNSGARYFLVPNLPPLGKMPSEVGGPGEAVLDARAAAFNADLDLRLDNLEQTLAGIRIFRVDFFTSFQMVLADPGAFGFTNTTDPAFDEKTGIVVTNPDQYLFWDTFHPTGPAHLLLGQEAARAVPEPATLLVMAALLPILLRTRGPGRRFRLEQAEPVQSAGRDRTHRHRRMRRHHVR